MRTQRKKLAAVAIFLLAFNTITISDHLSQIVLDLHVVWLIVLKGNSITLFVADLH